MTLIYKDLTYEIRKAIFYVHNHIGYGFDEDVYHQGLKSHFKKLGIPFQSKHRETLVHREKAIATFEYDFLVTNLVILELKAIQSNFHPDHQRQILEYLKFWNKNLGLLINFGFELVKIKRFPFEEKERKIDENYDHFKNVLDSQQRKEIATIRDAVLDCYKIHGLGYGDRVYNEIIKVEFDHRNIEWKTDIEIPIYLDELFIKNYKLPFLLVNGKYVVGIKALEDHISSYDVARTISYLRKLKLNLGLFLNFGRHALQINGIFTK